MLALSEDGTVFDRQFLIGDDRELKPRQRGKHKHGCYGYTYLHVDGDRGYVIYSENQENIQVAIFALADLS